MFVKEFGESLVSNSSKTKVLLFHESNIPARFVLFVSKLHNTSDSISFSFRFSTRILKITASTIGD